MAVPKKRTSKAKTRIRRAIWKKKIQKKLNKFYSTTLAKSIAEKRSLEKNECINIWDNRDRAPHVKVAVGFGKKSSKTTE